MLSTTNNINKEDVKLFFNRLADSWDLQQIREEEKIEKILDYAQIKEGVTVLDVACGTGVLIPDYLKRNVKRVTGVDISEEMIKRAKSKFQHEKEVEFYCADIETISLLEVYDTCMIYNAFPHFGNPNNLIKTLVQKIKPMGRLTIAHSMSREQLDKHHSGSAKKVSNGLISEEELAELLSPYFKVDVKISNEEMYIVSAVKK
ncbi:MAG: methyltransferase domain-containing protein [Lachnospiraceae bacterium]|nr:methyltransferase domain-containing protein [Lachnospiraceae bacterium]